MSDERKAQILTSLWLNVALASRRSFPKLWIPQCQAGLFFGGFTMAVCVSKHIIILYLPGSCTNPQRPLFQQMAETAITGCVTLNCESLSLKEKLDTVGRRAIKRLSWLRWKRLIPFSYECAKNTNSNQLSWCKDWKWRENGPKSQRCHPPGSIKLTTQHVTHHFVVILLFYAHNIQFISESAPSVTFKHNRQDVLNFLQAQASCLPAVASCLTHRQKVFTSYCS